MAPKILIAGAAGYIGGTLLEDIVNSKDELFESTVVYGTVRNKAQAASLSSLSSSSVQILIIDLSDALAVNEVIAAHEIDIVVNAASSFSRSIVSNLVQALGLRGKITNRKTHFIHSSVMAVFSPEGGWKSGYKVSDSEDLFGRESRLGYFHPIHDINVLVVEDSAKQQVTPFNIVVPIVYGRGSGLGKQISTFIPTIVKTGIKYQKVHKFDTDGCPPATHISDLSVLYILLLQKILRGDEVPSGEKGYYFAAAHSTSTWEIMEQIASSLHGRGLTTTPKVDIWPSDQMAAECLQYPEAFVRTMGGTYSGDFVPEHASALGWKPRWNKENLLQDIDDEVTAILEMGIIEDSRFYDLLDVKQ